jgi:hypothetical protein
VVYGLKNKAAVAVANLVTDSVLTAVGRRLTETGSR